MNRVMIYGGGLVGVIIMGICFVIVYQMTCFDQVRVVFLDVGQGDAILISQGSNQILIDGGPDSTALLEELGKNIPFWDRTIEIVIATHPDQDHIGGLIGVFDTYGVNQFWHSGSMKDTSVYNALERSRTKNEDTSAVRARYGVRAQIGHGELQVIYPYNIQETVIDDVNESSVAIVLRVGDESFYFGGDLSSEIEDMLPIEGITVAKASHHGSKYSTSEVFLKKLEPVNVIISAGKDNRYGHPHDDVLTRSYRAGARVFRTDQIGTILFTCKRGASCVQSAI